MFQLPSEISNLRLTLFDSQIEVTLADCPAAFFFPQLIEGIGDAPTAGVGHQSSQSDHLSRHPRWFATALLDGGKASELRVSGAVDE